MIEKIYLYVYSILFGRERYARKIGVTIGDDCRIYTRNFGSEPWLIEIGDRVTITAGVTLLTHDGATWLIRDKKGRRYSYGKVKIGSNVFVGINSIIMPGVIIGNKVIVAAGSVVTKSIPSGVIVAGNPAKIIGEFEQYESKVISYYSERDFSKHRSFKTATHQFSGNNIKNMLK